MYRELRPKHRRGYRSGGMATVLRFVSRSATGLTIGNIWQEIHYKYAIAVRTRQEKNSLDGRDGRKKHHKAAENLRASSLLSSTAAQLIRLGHVCSLSNRDIVRIIDLIHHLIGRRGRRRRLGRRTRSCAVCRLRMSARLRVTVTHALYAAVDPTKTH